MASKRAPCCTHGTDSVLISRRSGDSFSATSGSKPVVKSSDLASSVFPSPTPCRRPGFLSGGCGPARLHGSSPIDAGTMCTLPRTSGRPWSLTVRQRGCGAVRHEACFVRFGVNEDEPNARLVVIRRSVCVDRDRLPTSALGRNRQAWEGARRVEELEHLADALRTNNALQELK